MTKQQVLRHIGNPTRKVRDHGADCWQYAENRTFRGGTENAVRICFLSGVYSLDWEQINGKWIYTLPKYAAPTGS